MGLTAPTMTPEADVQNDEPQHQEVDSTIEVTSQEEFESEVFAEWVEKNYSEEEVKKADMGKIRNAFDAFIDSLIEE